MESVPGTREHTDERKIELAILMILDPECWEMKAFRWKSIGEGVFRS